jgi:hypothetical protein
VGALRDRQRRVAHEQALAYPAIGRRVGRALA